MLHSFWALDWELRSPKSKNEESRARGGGVDCRFNGLVYRIYWALS